VIIGCSCALASLRTGRSNLAQIRAHFIEIASSLRSSQ